MTALCPHCGALVITMRINQVESKDTAGKTWRTATFACQMCNKVLGANFDSVRFAQWIVDEVTKALREKAQ